MVCAHAIVHQNFVAIMKKMHARSIQLFVSRYAIPSVRGLRVVSQSAGCAQPLQSSSRSRDAWAEPTVTDASR